MDELDSNASRRDTTAPSFSAGPQRAELPLAVWGAAALIVVVAVLALAFVGHRRSAALPTTLQPPDAYAASLPLSGLAMSESSSLSGGTVTYLDGHVRNVGNRMVNAITVQVVFANDESMPPRIDTIPLTLIRTREPYVDTEPVIADPLRPGDAREFRLIFESIPSNWNQQMPQVRIIRTELQQ